MAELSPAIAHIASVPSAPSRAQQWAGRLMDLVFPPRCSVCKKTGAALCGGCQAKIRPVPQPVCRRCGRPTDGAVRCSVCGDGVFFVSAIRAAGLYTTPLSQAVRQFKYSKRTDLKTPLGGLLAAYWTSRSVSVDLVMAVPLHEKRLRERGYNQSELLAMELCRTARLPLLRQGVLVRCRHTRQQVLLNLAQRRQNVSGAFAWHGPPLDGLKVLLVDDVATTGSTLEACGEALHRAGAGRVWALTAARAVDGPFTFLQKGRSGTVHGSVSGRAVPQAGFAQEG